MLVSTHKLIIGLMVLLSWNTVQAQSVWTLQQCIDTAQAYNKNLQIYRNTILSSQEQEQEAKANLYPKLSVQADYKYFMELPHQLMPLSALNPQVTQGEFREIQFGVPHNINAHVQLVLPLYNAQIFGGIQNTKIAGELSQLQYKKTEEQVIFDITTLYYNAQVLNHQLMFIDSNIINVNKLLKNLQLLHEQLMVRGTEVNKVKLQADQLATQKDVISNKYEQVLNALKLQMGVPLNREVDLETEIIFTLLPNDNIQLTTDIQMIKVQNKLLNSQLKTLQQSRYLPSLNLIASYGASGFGYDKKPDNFLRFYSMGFAGVQLTYPLFNGTVTIRKMNQKKWEIKNNELQTQLISEKNQMEIENASRQKNTAIVTVINTENQIQQAQAIYNQTILQQKQGTANLTDVLIADNTLREAQQNHLSAIIDYLKSDLELRKFTGQLRVGN